MIGEKLFDRGDAQCSPTLVSERRNLGQEHHPKGNLLLAQLHLVGIQEDFDEKSLPN